MGVNTFLAEKLCPRGFLACLFALCVTHTNENTGVSLLKEFRARSIAAEAVYWGVCGALVKSASACFAPQVSLSRIASGCFHPEDERQHKVARI
jgi:hypothetical protein